MINLFHRYQTLLTLATPTQLNTLQKTSDTILSITEKARGSVKDGCDEDGGSDWLVMSTGIPHIEAKYRTIPYRILAGHSLTGLFAMSALLHQPPVFQGFIATDPSIWWDDRILLRQAEEAFAKTNAFRGAAFVSIAGIHVQRDWDDSLQQNAPRDFATLLQAHNSATFRSGSRTFEDENHVSAGLPGLYYGLQFLFDGYKVPLSYLKNPALIPGHFAAVSRRAGVQLLPDEKFVDMYAVSTLYDVHETNEAIEFFKINTANYPRSFIATPTRSWR